MAFIEKTDYADAIREVVLDDITEELDSLLDDAEKKAIAYMKGYLNNRYDVAAIFAAEGDERHPVILMYAIDISIFFLHRRVSWRNTPKFRIDRHNEAKDWLQKVSELEINDPLLPLIEDEEDVSRQYVQFGSNPRRSNHLDDAATDDE